MAKTRGVFAHICKYKTLLLSERTDGKGWNLPGGRVEEDEYDKEALAREVQEETGLKVQVLYQVGPEHVSGEDTSVAYACNVIGGTLMQTEEAKTHRFVTAQEVRQGYFILRRREAEDGIMFTTGEEKIPLKLVGPEGKLGRTGRKVWDALSLMENPSCDKPPSDQISKEEKPEVGALLFIGDCFYEYRPCEYWWCWPRLDPYSPTGRMQIQN